MYSVDKTSIVLLGDGIHGGIEGNGVSHDLHTHSSLYHTSFVVILQSANGERREEAVPKSESGVLNKLGDIGVSNNSTSTFNGKLLDIAIVARNEVSRDLADDRLTSSSLSFSGNILETSKIMQKTVRYPSHA